MKSLGRTRDPFWPFDLLREISAHVKLIHVNASESESLASLDSRSVCAVGTSSVELGSPIEGAKKHLHGQRCPQYC